MSGSPLFYFGGAKMRRLSDIYSCIMRVRHIENRELLDIYEKNIEKEKAEAEAVIVALNELLEEVRKRKKEMS